MAAFGGGFTQQGASGAYGPGAARPKPTASMGTPYRPPSNSDMAVYKPAARNVDGDPGFEQWYAAKSLVGPSESPERRRLDRQRGRDQWARWTSQQRDAALREAALESPSASRANTSSLPYADYTDPSTGEKFLADKDGRLTRPTNVSQHLAGIGNPAAIAQMAAQYHDAGASIPQWLTSAASGVGKQIPWSGFALRYLDRGMWDRAGDNMRYQVRRGNV